MTKIEKITVLKKIVEKILDNKLIKDDVSIMINGIVIKKLRAIFIYHDDEIEYLYIDGNKLLLIVISLKDTINIDILN